MPNSSEGVRRLSIFAGSICAFLFFAWVFMKSDAFTDLDFVNLLMFIGFLAASFFFPFALVRFGAWVIAGFMRK